MTRDLSIEPGKATLWGTPLSFVLLGVVLVPHQLIHHENALKSLFRATGGWWFGPVLIAGIIAHEAIHALTWIASGRLGRGSVRFGVNWRHLMPYANPIAPLDVRAYALGAAAPGVLLGVVPAVIGVATGSGAWSGWGAIFSAAAAGDLLVLSTLVGVPRGSLVLDHPTRVGCEIVDDGDGGSTGLA